MAIFLRILYTTWWLTYPSEKYEFGNWDDDIPNIWKSKKLSKPPTSIHRLSVLIIEHSSSWIMSCPRVDTQSCTPFQIAVHFMREVTPCSHSQLYPQFDHLRPPSKNLLPASPKVSAQRGKKEAALLRDHGFQRGLPGIIQAGCHPSPSGPAVGLGQASAR